MRHLYSVILKTCMTAVFLLALATTASAQEGGFLSGVEDLPLMAGMVESTEASLVFDSPSGRYVEAFVSGPQTLDGVRQYYSATLPQLGWLSQGPGIYERDGEILRIDLIDEQAGELVIRFSLSPKP